jgi:hypothetical protein
MKFLFILSLMLSSVLVFAQQEGVTHKPEKELLTSKLRRKIKSFSKVSIDTLKPAIIDSVSRKGKSSLSAFKSVKDSVKMPNLQDSLSALTNYAMDSVTRKSNAFKSSLQGKGDSIQSLAGNVATRIEGVGDQLHSKVKKVEEEVNQVEEKLNENVTKAEKKMDNVEKKATSTLEDAKSKLDDKLNGIGSDKLNLPTNIQDKLDIPKLDLPKESLPSLNKEMPNLDVKSPDLNLDPSLKTNLPNVGGNDLSNLGEKVNVPDIDKSFLGALNKVGEIANQTKDIDKNLAVAEEYEKELQKIREGNLSELEKLSGEAEKQIGQLDQVKGLSDEINKATAQQAQYQAMIQNYQDKKLLQEEMMRKVANVANDQLTKYAADVQQAQSKLSKAKRGFGQIKSVKDIFKVKSDELVGKRFYERIVPGLTTQVYTKEYTQMDIALQLGYRFMPRITAGIGASYRVGFNRKFDYFVNNEQVYSGRVYFDFAIKSGIFFHGEFETLKFNPQKLMVASATSNENLPNFVYDSYFGFGKCFNVSRQIRANVTTLYRVEYEGKLPSMSKLNLRIGFDYMFGNRRRKV